MNLENLLSFPQAFLFWISFFQYIESLDKVLFAIFDNVYVYFLSLSLVSPTSLVCCDSLVLIFQEFSLLLYYFLSIHFFYKLIFVFPFLTLIALIAALSNVFHYV